MVARWKCYRYKGFYSVNAEIYSPVLDEWFKISFILDTGFKGDIFLERKTYDLLKLPLVELPTRMAPVAKTLAGSIPLRVSLTKIKIANKVFQVCVYTPKYGYGKNLMGRGVLNKLIVMLMKRDKTCIKLE